MRVRDINGSKKKTRIMAANSAGGCAEGGRGRNSHHTHEKIPKKYGDSTEVKNTPKGIYQ
jgi:hypothetical protein